LGFITPGAKFVSEFRQPLLPPPSQLHPPRRSDPRRRVRLSWLSPGRTHEPEHPRGRSGRRADRSGSSVRLSPCATASSEASGSYLVFPGSSPITSPGLVRKALLTEVRALPSPGVTQVRQYYDPLPVPAEPPSLAKALELILRPNGGSPRPPSLHAVPTTPVDRTGAPVGVFPARAAFPAPEAGRHPRLHLRGLLSLHTCYRLQGCSAT